MCKIMEIETKNISQGYSFLSRFQFYVPAQKRRTIGSQLYKTNTLF